MILWFLFFLSYTLMSWYHLRQAASPIAPCSGNPKHWCFRPIISKHEAMTLELWLLQDVNETSKWYPEENCQLNFSLPDPSIVPLHLTKNETCQVEIPAFARHRSVDRKLVKPLKAKLVFRLSNGDEVLEIPFYLTRIKQLRKKGFLAGSSANKAAPRNLLAEPSGQANQIVKEAEDLMWVPYLKYGRSPVRVRFVSEFREYGRPKRVDGVTLQLWNQTTYKPIAYVDDLSLPYSSQIELAPPDVNKPPVKIQIKISSIYPVIDAINQEAKRGFQTLESIIPAEDLDEVRYMIQDERLYRFLLTQIISYVHMWLDYLAFRDETQFYRGRENLSGVSTSTVLTRFVCSFIILLYLLDGGVTSWVVLFSLFSSCAVEGWKVWKLLRPTFSFSFPFVSFRQLQSSKEKQTAEYDRIATKNLGMILYPGIVGWSLYALKHYEYSSWYSWLVSNLANAVYTFGFISLTPQLYVNYRLKSVAHLPWKVFLYKIFNTFVDDAFAWLIDMPWKHRIMTLRDDFIFLLFLIQVYLYKVDKTRTNEYGYAFEESKEEEPKEEEPKEKKD